MRMFHFCESGLRDEKYASAGSSDVRQAQHIRAHVAYTLVRYLSAEVTSAGADIEAAQSVPRARRIVV
jgi:hypothetical protein